MELDKDKKSSIPPLVKASRLVIIDQSILINTSKTSY